LEVFYAYCNRQTGQHQPARRDPKKMKLESGCYLDMEVMEGGTIVLNPVAVYPTVQLSEDGLKKLQEARKSGKTEMPKWLKKEIK
jgi:hypothetical protein